jgi:tetratricopeptide (TPR) repeat protein
VDYVSRLIGSALYWPIALALLALVVYGLVLGGLGFQNGPSISLVLFLFGAGLLTLWQRRNRFLRAAIGPDRHLFRGLLYEQFGKHEKALCALSLHLERFPGNVQTLQKRAEVLQRLGLVDEALADLDRALDPYPDPDLLNRRGLFLQSIGAHREALADFEYAATLRGRPPGFLCAGPLIEQRLLDRALAALDPSGPEEGHRYFAVHRRWYRGEAFRLLGREAEANVCFQEAMDGLNTEPPVHDRDSRFHCVPDILGHLGRNDEARQLIEFGMNARKAVVSSDIRLMVALRAGAVSEAQNLITGMMNNNPSTIVSVLSDPEFTTYLANELFRSLFTRAVHQRDELVERVLSTRRAVESEGSATTPGHPSGGPRG